MSSNGPIYITPSTSVVLVNTVDYSGNPIVLLPNINSLGRIITIRDADGGSFTKPIYISTTGGALFQNEISSVTVSSFRITQPYGFLTVIPRLIDGGGNTRYGLMNSFAFPEASDVAYLNIFNANLSYASTLSTVNLAVSQDATVQGNVYIGGNFQFLSSSANTFSANTIQTNLLSTGVIRAQQIYTSTLMTSTVQGKSIYLDETLETSSIRVRNRVLLDLSGSVSWNTGSGLDASSNSMQLGDPANYAGAEIGTGSNFFGIRAFSKGLANFSTTLIMNAGNFGFNIDSSNLNSIAGSKYTLYAKGALRLSNDNSALNNIAQRTDNSLSGSNRYVNTFGAQSNYILYSASNYTQGFYSGTTEWKWITVDKGSLYPETIRFWTSNDAVPRMAITSNGFIGIGNTAPEYTLDVTGNMRVTGNFRINNNFPIMGQNTSLVYEDCFFPRASDNNTFLNYGSGGNFIVRNNSSSNRFTVSENQQTMQFGNATGTTTFAYDGIQIGTGTTSNQNAYIDFVGDTTYTDYGLRIIRSSGLNGDTRVEHRGTGDFKIYTYEAAPITFTTSGTERMRIASGGSIGIGNTSPDNNYRLDIASAGKAGSIKLDGTNAAVIDNARNRAVDGGIGTPAYTFLNDENTGMFSGGADILSFTCGGNNRCSIRTDGATFTQYTGVTTSAESALKLENASGAAERLMFFTKLSAGAYNSITQSGDAGIIYGTSAAPTNLVIAPHSAGPSGIRIDSSGNVGIGKSNPTVALDVSGYIKSNMVGFHIKRGTVSPGIFIGGSTKITGTQWDTILHNINGGWNASTGYFTAPINGYYTFTCVLYGDSGSASFASFTIRKNATSAANGTVYTGGFQFGENSGLNSSYITATAFIQLNASETVSVWSGTNGVSMNNGFDDNPCSFCGYLLMAS